MSKPTVAEVVDALEKAAPPDLALPGDNVGLLVGDPAAEVTTVVAALDATGAVIDEALALGAELIVTHHPLIYAPLRRVSEAETAGRLVGRLVRSGISCAAAHSNLDAARGGTAEALAERLGIAAPRPLPAAPTGGRPLPAGNFPEKVKVVTFLPAGEVPALQRAVFEAGAGVIGAYRECSFRAAGTGTFLASPGSRPAVGRAGMREDTAEERIEFVCSRDRLEAVLDALRRTHPYEEPAVDVYPLLRAVSAGVGRVGDLDRPIACRDFALHIMEALGCPGMQAAGPADRFERQVRRVAVVPGAWKEAVRSAVSAGADCLVVGEVDHHSALEAESAGLVVLAPGHSATERVVLPRIAAALREALPAVKVHVSTRERDPIGWFPG